MDATSTPDRKLYIVRWMIAGAFFGALFPLTAWRLAVAEAGPLSIGELHSIFPMLWIVDLAPSVLGLGGGVIGLLYARLARSKSETEHTARQIAAAWTEELHNANVELADALESRSTFYAAVAHEFRSPLTTIVGFADVAEELVYEPPELSTYISEIYAAASALLGMVNDLLDAAKLEASGITVEMRQVACADVVADVLSQLKPLAAQKSLLLSTPPPTDVECFADPSRLRQVLTNVVANAIKYSEGGMIEVIVHDVDGAPVIDVVDQGVGINPTELESIFDAFDSGSSGNGRRDSSGLGLAISRSLIEAMDGNISARSDGVGHGSTFRLTLCPIEGREPEARTASLVPAAG